MFEHTFKDMVCSKNMILPVLNTSLLYIYTYIASVAMGSKLYKQTVGPQDPKVYNVNMQ